MSDIYIGIPFSGCEKYVSNPIIGTREDECIGIAVGAWFTGKKPTVFMQNSGLGNCIDIITSLLKPYKIPIELIIDNRTSPEHHSLMGKITLNLLNEMEYETFRLYQEDHG